MKTKCITQYWVIALTMMAIRTGSVLAQTPLPAKVADLWNAPELFEPPKMYPAADDYGAADLQAIFYDGPNWQGKPTRVFAYLGLPEGASADNPAPGIVCVHGGGGTAYADWVRLWNKNGYAAIAMDTGGTVPTGKHPDRPRHEWAGPGETGDQTGAGFLQAGQPLRDHWYYHAVADVILANSLLRSMPEVDADAIGVTGISWGGYKTCITVGLDHRFKFAIPVYGCGFLDEDSTFIERIEFYGKKQWMTYWDPSVYLPAARVPMLWVNGTNDKHYHMPSFQQSYQATAAPLTRLAIRVEMLHSHPAGWEPKEIYAFADQINKRGPALAAVTDQGGKDDAVWVSYLADREAQVIAAEFNYTTDQGPWPQRKWHTVAAELDASLLRATATLPAGAAAYYFNLIDKRNLISSSPHQVAAPKPTCQRRQD